MVILQLSPLEVFTQWNFVADFIRYKLIFVIKNDKFASWAALEGTRANERTSSIAHWKVHGSLCDIWTFCTMSYGWDYEWKFVKVGVFRRGWVTLSANFRWKGTSPINPSWCQKTRAIALVITSALFISFCYKPHVWWTTDRQNYTSPRLFYHCCVLW